MSGVDVATHSTLGMGGANGVAIQPDGKLVVVGATGATGDTENVLVLRYNANGTLDTTFSGDGVATYSTRGLGGGHGLPGQASHTDGHGRLEGAESRGQGGTGTASALSERSYRGEPMGAGEVADGGA